MKKSLFIVILCLLAAIFSACGDGNANGNADVEYAAFTSVNGYTVDIPQDWISDEAGMQATFLSPDTLVALCIETELGGVEYYSLTEMGDELIAEMESYLFAEVSETSDAKETENTYYRVIQGTDSDDMALTTVLYIYEPIEAVRYYLLFVATSEEYNDGNDDLIAEIIDSFEVTMTEDELYELTMDKNSQTAEEDSLDEESQLETEGEETVE